jgi:hypothetical protein
VVSKTRSSADNANAPHKPEWRKKRAEVASLSYWHPDSTDLVDARCDLKAMALEEHIERVVRDWPPLTNAQRAKLAELLAPVRVTGGARE